MLDKLQINKNYIFKRLKVIVINYIFVNSQHRKNCIKFN